MRGGGGITRYVHNLQQQIYFLELESQMLRQRQAHGVSAGGSNGAAQRQSGGTGGASGGGSFAASYSAGGGGGGGASGGGSGVVGGGGGSGGGGGGGAPSAGDLPGYGQPFAPFGNFGFEGGEEPSAFDDIFTQVGAASSRPASAVVQRSASRCITRMRRDDVDDA